MYIFNEEHKIGKAFLEKPWKKLTYLEVRKLSGKKSKSYIYRALNHLMHNEIIMTEQVGRSLLYYPTLNFLQTQSYLGSLNEHLSWQATHIHSNILERLADKIIKITPFFILIVAGSYANRTQTKKSDLDVVIICDDKINPKTIMAEIKLESVMSIPQVHPFVFTKKEFLEMLTNKGINYGKEVVNNNMIFFGGENYYNIINEAIQHGFRG